MTADHVGPCRVAAAQSTPAPAERKNFGRCTCVAWDCRGDERCGYCRAASAAPVEPPPAESAGACRNCGVALKMTQRIWLRPDGSFWCVRCGTSEQRAESPVEPTMPAEERP